MSLVFGVQLLKAKLAAYEAAVKSEMEKKLPQLALQLQATMVSHTPVSTALHRGTHLRDLLASSEAVKTVTRAGRITIEVGFVTTALQKQGYYAQWVERGRKAYKAGGTRRAGKDKLGRQRLQKVKRNIGAMPATLFMQVSFLEWRRTIERDKALAKIVAAARVVL